VNLSTTPRSLFLVAASCVLLPLESQAQSAALPQVSAGDTWRFAVYYTVPSTEPNRTWVIKSVGKERIEAAENGEPLTLTPELNVLDSPRHSESNPKALSFPLEVGKRWRYETDWLFKGKGSRGGVAVDVAVVGREMIRVPAGEFEAYRLEAKGELSGHSPSNTFYAGQTTTTYWYAPAVRAIVKSVHHNPYLGTTNVQLVDFKIR